jgi:phosphate transport system protein
LYRDVFDRELLTIREQVVDMSGLVRRALSDSIRVLKSRNLAAAAELVEADEEINRMRYDIEEGCLTMIATQQPVAGDLRSIFSILEIATELERLGDYAKGIARISIAIGEKPLIKPLVDLPVMAQKACAMLEEAMGAFVSGSVELAEQVASRDVEIDQFNSQIQRELLTFIMEDPRNIAGALQLTWVAHNLERTGDRIVNICERIIFTVTGEQRDLD